MNDLLESARSELAGYADEQIAHAVLALEIDRARNDLLLVQEDRFDHLDDRRSRRIPRARAHELRNLGAPVRRARHDRVDCRLVHQVGDRDAGDSRVTRQRHHRVAVAAEDEGMDVVDRHVELFRDERPHARRVQRARHADDALARKLRQLVDRLRHRVERIADGDDDAVGRVLYDLLGDLLHDLVVHVQQIVAAHARLARHPRRDDDDVRVGALGVIAGAEHAGIGSPDRARLEHVERDAGRLLIRDIDHHDVGELLVGDAARHGRADVSGAADDCYLPIHRCSFESRNSRTHEIHEKHRLISCLS